MGRTSRLSSLGIILAGGLAAGAFAAASQEATDPAKQNAPQQQRAAWLSTCSSAGRGLPLECALEQRAFAKENGQLIGMITIRVPSDTKKPVSMIQAPLGLFLPAGVTVDVDGDMAQNHPFQTCNANGCFVGFPVTDNLLKQMSNGAKLNITFQYLNKKPLVLPMSLVGFTEAYNRIK